MDQGNLEIRKEKVGDFLHSGGVMLWFWLIFRVAQLNFLFVYFTYSSCYLLDIRLIILIHYSGLLTLMPNSGFLALLTNSTMDL